MNHLRDIRKRQGLPLAALAVRSKSGINTLIQIEKYSHMPRHETREKIAKALGVEMHAIWPCSNQPTTPTAA